MTRRNSMYYLSSFARPQGAKDKQKRKSRALNVASKTAIGAGVGAGIGAGVGVATGSQYYLKSRRHPFGKGTNYTQGFFTLGNLRSELEYLSRKNPELNKKEIKNLFRKKTKPQFKEALKSYITRDLKKVVPRSVGIGALGLGAYQLGKTAKKD